MSDIIRVIRINPVISMYKSREKEGQVVIDTKDIGFMRFGFDGLYLSYDYCKNGEIKGVDLVEE